MKNTVEKCTLPGVIVIDLCALSERYLSVCLNHVDRHLALAHPFTLTESKYFLYFVEN